MFTAVKIKPFKTAYLFTLILVFIILGLYGREAVVWIMTKLYEFFIMRNPVL